MFSAWQVMREELAACGYSSSCDALMHWHVLNDHEEENHDKDTNPGYPSSSATTACQQPSSPAAARQQQQQQQQPNGPNSADDKRFRRYRMQFASKYAAALVASKATPNVRSTCVHFLIMAAKGRHLPRWSRG